jgi:hypothetical protein
MVSVRDQHLDAAINQFLDRDRFYGRLRCDGHKNRCGHFSARGDHFPAARTGSFIFTFNGKFHIKSGFMPNNK